jgi:hypothetical protein
MTNLADQILARVPEGRTVARAQLALGANYDSVGRVLRQLVDQRQLVKVGRGRYRRAAGKRPASSATIAEAIRRKVARSSRNVFLRADFARQGSYDAVGRALRQLVESGSLVQIGYGLYAKAERSPFNGKPAPVVGIRRLAAEALGRLGKTVAPSKAEAAYNSGRSTQVPTGRRIAVKDRVSRRIGYDGRYVVLERA